MPGRAHDHGGALQALLDAGEARTTFKHVAVTHAEGKRWISCDALKHNADGERNLERGQRARVLYDSSGRTSRLVVDGDPRRQLRRLRRRGHA